MAYYHDQVTEQSWQELQVLRRRLNFILIGGWATYLYTKTLKSKDIDILCEFEQLATLAKHYALVKNERLRKYEAVKGAVQIDVYLPHYSALGIPVEILRQHIREHEGYRLLHPDYLLALKIHTLSQRARSAKGHKDLIDCVALMRSEAPDVAESVRLLKTHGLGSALDTLRALLQEHREIPELDLNAHHLAKLKKRISSAL